MPEERGPSSEHSHRRLEVSIDIECDIFGIWSAERCEGHDFDVVAGGGKARAFRGNSCDIISIFRITAAILSGVMEWNGINLLLQAKRGNGREMLSKKATTAAAIM